MRPPYQDSPLLCYFSSSNYFTLAKNGSLNSPVQLAASIKHNKLLGSSVIYT